MSKRMRRLTVWSFFLAAAIAALSPLAWCQPIPSCYHSPAQIDSFIHALDARDTLGIMHIDSIGHSRGDMLGVVFPIWAVKISDNADVFEDEPTSLIIGHIHGEEVIGLELTLEFIRRLVDEYGLYRNLVNATQMYFIPTMNPDGLEVVTRGLDNTWRKNGYVPPELFGRPCTIVPGVGEDSCGVDLNRNFDLNWIYGDTLWYRADAEPFDYYRGPAAFSEPETQAVRDFAMRIKPTLSVVAHTSRSGNVTEMGIVAWKWGPDPGPYKFPPDCTSIGWLNHEYCALLQNSQGSGYQPNFGNTHNGCLQDWFYRQLGTVQILTELGPPVNIQPQCSTLTRIIEQDIPSLNWLNRRLVNLGHDGLTPLAIYTRDSLTGEPISAEWRNLNPGAWSPVLAPWYTNEEYGRATALYLPGPVTIMARKEGYRPDTVTTVVLPSSGTQSIVLDLAPLPWHNLSVHLVDQYGRPFAGRVYLDSDYPRWVDVPEEGASVDIPEGEYTARFEADYPEGTSFAWESFYLSEDRSRTVGLGTPVDDFSEDFESGLGNWTVGGTGGNWRLDPDTTAMSFGLSLHTNPAGFRAVYPDGADTWITYNNAISIAASWIPSAWLEFYRRGRLDVPTDSLFVEISLDGGDSWEVAAGFSDMELPWTRTVVNLTPWNAHTFNLRFRLKTDDVLGELGIHVDNVKVRNVVETAAPDIPQPIPYRYRITGSYPNPFNSSTTIAYEVAGPGEVKLVVFNLIGQEVRRFTEHHTSAGPQRMTWNGLGETGLPLTSGLYFVRLEAGGVHNTHKLLLLR